jgi:hypothetical protein
MGTYCIAKESNQRACCASFSRGLEHELNDMYDVGSTHFSGV